MLSAFTTVEALQKCQAADVPAVRVLDPSEVAHDIHVKEVGSIAEIEHPIVGKNESSTSRSDLQQHHRT